MTRPLSILPRLSARPTIPAPPASYEAALAAAQARLDEATLDAEAGEPDFAWPASFGAPCERCGGPRLSALETLCAECEVAS